MEQVVVDGLLNLCLTKEEEEEITITTRCRSDLASGKVGFDKSRSTSSGDRDENSGDRDAENVQTTARNPQASATEGGEGGSGIGKKQTLSDKESMMGWEVTGSPMCQSAQKSDGQNNSTQIRLERAPEQNPIPWANLDSSPNGPFSAMDKDRRADYVLSLSDVGHQVNVEKEMIDVSSPSKQRTSPRNTKKFAEDNLSPKGEENGKAIRHWKRIAREKDYPETPQSHNWSFLDMALHLCHSKASQVWLMANNTLEDFKKAASLDIIPPRHSQIRWEAPPLGVFKINVDGATSDQGRNSSIGVIIRDSNGLVVAALNKYLPGRFAADQVEALALEQGILLAGDLQLSRVILECDELAVIQALNDNSTGNELGHILQGIRRVSESFEFCTFQHVNRTFNVVAHELAQLARREESSCMWYGVPPPAVLSLVHNDMLYRA
ncbi:putative ribonuclease h protein [Quercus suber]|uniref:Ribonuclease h protein n=1 Tax=Quercus suber TaxID=58331 RepID=A0AAW0LG29_QUESU